MKKKKVMSLLLIAAMTASMAAGCSSSGGSKDGGDSKDDGSKADSGGEEVTLTVLAGQSTTDAGIEDMIDDAMAEKYPEITLEWECVTDPTQSEDVKKCGHITGGAIYGKPGATLRVPQTSSCTDCEQMVTDPDTCESVCIPDPTRIGDGKCYPGTTTECSGTSRGFYFGFPSKQYAENVPAISNKSVPIDAAHSQNRKFNCMDCGDRTIDTEKSLPPYIAICK